MTSSPPSTDRRARFIETMGLLTEEQGMARIMGRIFGLLLLADRPLSLADIADALGVSRASVSTDARRLLERGLLVRTSEPGDRRDFYELAPDFVRRAMRSHMERMHALQSALADARDGLDTSEQVHARLSEFAAVFEDGIARLQQSLSAFDRDEPRVARLDRA
jgi:DNA-binding transcriptional regulator GbsR (MarR family)